MKGPCIRSECGWVDQPYQYVGELGYYTHWQEPEFGLLQLGVRFYDAEVGRFSQKDALALDSVADTLYASANPTVMVDPDGLKCRKFGKSPTVQNCWNTLSKCVGGDPFFGRARKIVSDDILMCTGDGSFWPFYDETNGYTTCDGKGGGMHCQIRFFNDSVFKNGNDFCKTMLHELLHVGNWPRSDKRAEDEIGNATNYLWDYKCNASDPCYGKKIPDDWHKIVDPWVR